MSNNFPAEIQLLRATNAGLYAQLEEAQFTIARLEALVQEKEDALQFERNRAQIYLWLHELDYEHDDLHY